MHALKYTIVADTVLMELQARIRHRNIAQLNEYLENVCTMPSKKQKQLEDLVFLAHLYSVYPKTCIYKHWHTANYREFHVEVLH